MKRLCSVCDLSDKTLMLRLGELVGKQRGIEAEVLAHLAEVDRRRLYLGRACASMFAYCTEVLHMSEDAAYRRIHAARAARAYPLILELLRRGELHLSGVSKLAPHLTRDNHAELLSRAKHRTKRQIEQLLAEKFPQPDAPASIRKLPPPRPAVAPTPMELQPTRVDALTAPGPAGSRASSEAAARATPLLSTNRVPSSVQTSTVTPLAPRRFKVQFTASDALRDKIEEARDLLAHQLPDRPPSVQAAQQPPGSARLRRSARS